MEFLTNLRHRSSMLVRTALKRPLRVTTLVPAYKVKYLEELLSSLQHQIVKPTRVIISDDSPDQAFVRAINSEALKPALVGLNVSVIPGPRTGAYNNFCNLVNQLRGETELFHFLLDDDVIYPRFYESHIAAHTQRNFSCSISRRWTALESGQPVGALKVPRRVARRPQHVLTLDANEAFSATLPRCTNWFGEFSNVVLKSELADMIHDTSMGGISFTGLEDMGTFLNASLHAPIAFINDHLGYFRTSPQQHSSDLMGRPIKLSHLAWFALALGARRIGRLQPRQVRKSVACMGRIVLSAYTNEADMTPFRELMPALMAGEAAAEDRFIEAWAAYRAAG